MFERGEFLEAPVAFGAKRKSASDRALANAVGPYLMLSEDGRSEMKASPMLLQSRIVML